MESSNDKSRLAVIESQIERVKVKIRHLREEQRLLEDEKEQIVLRKKMKVKVTDSQKYRNSEFIWSADIKQILRSTFGIQDFRRLQEAAINCVLSGFDCILIMPTGGGKSICYQLPCVQLKGLVLVITPLVSLMEDQVMHLKNMNENFPVYCLHSQLPKDINSSVLKKMLFPSDAPDSMLLYVTPERLAKSKMFMTKLQKCWEMKKLKLIAIDEVHCCSQWGHDFRQDYNYLGILKTQFPGVPMLGLTATATDNIVNDCAEMLTLENHVVLRDNFNRPNLAYAVYHAQKSDLTDIIAKMIKCKYDGRSGIIYCFSIKECTDVAKQLSADYGITAYPYHASLDSEYRSRVHKRWSTGKIQVVVATVAFGMGIDKPDVRFVIHYSIPKSMENYYQESGRAGRDGNPADCIVYFKFQDMFRQSTMVFSEKNGLRNLYKMVAYCLNKTQCRRTLLAEHFCEGAKLDCAAVDGQIHCDNCEQTAESKRVDVSFYLKAMNSAITDADKTETRLTGLKMVEAIKKCSIKGSGTELSKERLEHIVCWSLNEGYLCEKFHFTPYSTISYLAAGSALGGVLSGQKKAIMSCVLKGVKRKQEGRGDIPVITID